MIEFLENWFDASGFTPLGNSAGWTKGHAWLHIIADVAIFVAVAGIACILSFYAVRRSDVPLPSVCWAWIALLFLTGTGHVVQASIFWHPWHRVSGFTKLLTALLAWLTAIATVRAIPSIIRLPGMVQRNHLLQQQVDQSHTIEQSLRQRVAELERVNSELEFVSRGMVGREERILELKREVNQLLERGGEPPRYQAAKEPPI